MHRSNSLEREPGTRGRHPSVLIVFTERQDVSAMTNPTDIGNQIRAIHHALESFDWQLVSQLSEVQAAMLHRAPDVMPVESAVELLNRLRRKRRFADLAVVADALLANGQQNPTVVRLYAQALIEEGRFGAAAAMLERIIAGDAPPSERIEAKGLLGRTYKQLYVNADDPGNNRQQENLRRAIRSYYEVYASDSDCHLWHGINTVALLARARADEVTIRDLPSETQIARSIQAVLNRRKTLDHADRATAIETALVLGEFSLAYDHLLYYALDPEVDAFECGSLMRQLTRVWRLQAERVPGSILIPTLEAALLRRTGGKIVVAPGDAPKQQERVLKARHTLEAVFGADRYQPLAWMETALKRCRAVARIESVTRQKIGTGFLVRRRDFFSGGGSELVLLTNSHVIAPEGRNSHNAIAPDAACAVFEALDNRTVLVKSALWSSPPDQFDATFVSLREFDPEGEVCPIDPEPQPFLSDNAQHLFVIGHPLGGGLSVSLQNSMWLDMDARRLHYRTPTEPGSSGSPVFDQDYWTLVGLHHAASARMPRLNGADGTYEANEGISIDAIRKQTQQQGERNEC